MAVFVEKGRKMNSGVQRSHSVGVGVGGSSVVFMWLSQLSALHCTKRGPSGRLWPVINDGPTALVQHGWQVHHTIARHEQPETAGRAERGGGRGGIREPWVFCVIFL